MRTPEPPSVQRRPAIAVGAAVLAILTVLGTAPAPEEGDPWVRPVPMEVGSAPVEESTMTFAEAFELARTPEPEVAGEGQEAVAVAAPATTSPVSAQVPTAAPVPVLPDVEPVRPTLAVRGAEPEDLAEITGIEGVAAAASALVGEVEVATPGGEQVVTVAAVDPEAFRPLTPEITANERAVWERLVAGDAAFNHDAGNRLTLPLGTTVSAGRGQVRIGAYASNGIPPVADALVSEEVAGRLGLVGLPTIYVALAPGADGDAVAAAIGEAAGEAVVEAIEQPAEEQAFLTGSAAAEFFEPFNYIDHGDGLITIDSDWVARNIETRMLPIFQGPVTCHRQMLVQLEGALAEVEAAGLAGLIDVNDYGGCWVARHIDWSPRRPLSMHAWGLAVDFNVQTNQLGARPTMDPRIVAIFDRWGFVWGGRWSRPDGMHFELGAVLQAPTGQ